MGVASRLSGVELLEMKMFQTRHGDQLLHSDMDACELGARDPEHRNVGKKRVDIHDQQ